VDLLELLMNATEGIAGEGGVHTANGTGAPGENGVGGGEKENGGYGAQRAAADPGSADGQLRDVPPGRPRTTAMLLTWATLLLSQHPEWQTRAREEVNALFAANGGGTPSFDQLSELKIVGWILQETLRLYPPAAIMGRSCTKTTKLSTPSPCQLAATSSSRLRLSTEQGAMGDAECQAGEVCQQGSGRQPRIRTPSCRSASAQGRASAELCNG